MFWALLIVPAAAVLTAVTLNFLSSITGVLQLVVISQFVAFALEPGVNWIATNWGWRRGAATAALMATIALVCVGVLVLILPSLISELAGFIGTLPDVLAELGERFGFDVSAENIRQAFEEEQSNVASFASDLAANALRLTGSLLGLVGKLSVVGLLSFYLTAEAPKVRRNLLGLLPQKQQLEMLRLWEISTDKIGGYLYSRALMGVISGLASYTIIRVLGVPFAAPMAIFVGFVSQFVPIVGTYIAYSLPSILALTTKGIRSAIVIVVFAALYQQLENLLISPKLSARTMKLHPAVAFVAALIGGAVGGPSSAFLALPVAAIFQAFGSTFLKRYEVVDDALTPPGSLVADPSITRQPTKERTS